jgi:hypothetical protein
MNTIQVDQRTTDILKQVHELAELRDAHGALIGILIPATARKARAWAEVEDKVDTINLLHGKTSHSYAFTFRQMWEHILEQAPADIPATDINDVREMIARKRIEEAGETLVDDDSPGSNPLDEATGTV